MTAEPIVELRNVGISFEEHTVHHDISFRIFPGEGITILGPSGIGKTLILKMIIGLLRPSHGEVEVLGTCISSLPEAELRLVRKNIGMLFQGAALFDSLSVFDNVAYSLREYGETPEDEIQQIVQEKLGVIGLPGIGHKFPAELSGGQKKRVGLARALASSPRIVLFDEPTTGLDPTAIRMIDELILKLKDEFGITCISVTHDIASAKRISDRWFLINNGTVIADGPVDEVSQSSHDVVAFISGNWKGE